MIVDKRFPVRFTNETKDKAVTNFNKKQKDNNIKLNELNCDLCDSNSNIILFTSDCHGIDCQTVLCKKCGFVYSNPRMDKLSNELFYTSDEYRTIYTGKNFIDKCNDLYVLAEQTKVNEISSEAYNLFYFFKLINDSNIKFKSVMEVGSSNGANLIPFQNEGIKCKGLEYNESLVQIGNKRGLDLQQGGLEDIEGKYDLIFLRHVFEHLLDPHEALGILRKSTNKYLLIEVPGFITKVPKLQNAHQLYFSYNTLNFLLASYGFKEVTSKVFSSNNFILVLYEKCEPFDYRYNKVLEFVNVLKITYLFYIKQLLKRIFIR